MVNTLTPILKETLIKEGDEIDKLLPGIVSKYGVRQEILDVYNTRKGLPLESVETLAQPKAEGIYREMFYTEPGYDKLSPAIARQVFNFGVQSGPPKSTMVLQSIVGAKPDGRLGPKTMKAVEVYVEKNGEDKLAQEIINTRRKYIEYLIKKNPKKYGEIQKGLRNRVNSMEKE